MIAITLSAALFLSACGLFSPTPNNEQIIAAIPASNDVQKEPLELVCEEMQVPYRYSGKAGAVVWVKDRSIQVNFHITYDKKQSPFMSLALQRSDSVRTAPTNNAHIESFNGSFRDECLNTNWFMSLEDVQEKIERWRKDYNEFRSHSALTYLASAEYARNIGLVDV